MFDTLMPLTNGLAADAGGGILAMLFSGTYLVILLVACVIIGYPIYVLGQRANHPTPWFGFIPILNIIILCQLAEIEMYWVLLSIFIPFCGLYPWYKVAEKQGKNGWVCLGFFIPCVGFLTPYYIAFM